MKRDRLALLLLALGLGSCQATRPTGPPAADEPELARGAAERDLERATSAPERGARLAAARSGLRHARRLCELRPNDARGHFTTALLIGRALDNEVIPSLSEVPEMQAAAERAARLDESLDRGGPYRLLALLHAKAPAWPVSVGDAEEALRYAHQAIRVAPRWPENHLTLAEVLAEDDAREGALMTLKVAEQMLAQTERPAGLDAKTEQALRARMKKLAEALRGGR